MKVLHFVISCHQHFPILFKNDDEQIYLKKIRFMLPLFLWGASSSICLSACEDSGSASETAGRNCGLKMLMFLALPLYFPSQLLPPYFLEWTILDKYICNGPLPSCIALFKLANKLITWAEAGNPNNSETSDFCALKMKSLLPLVVWNTFVAEAEAPSWFCGRLFKNVMTFELP